MGVEAGVWVWVWCTVDVIRQNLPRLPDRKKFAKVADTENLNDYTER